MRQRTVRQKTPEELESLREEMHRLIAKYPVPGIHFQALHWVFEQLLELETSKYPNVFRLYAEEIQQLVKIILTEIKKEDGSFFGSRPRGNSLVSEFCGAAALSYGLRTQLLSGDGELILEIVKNRISTTQSAISDFALLAGLLCDGRFNSSALIKDCNIASKVSRINEVIECIQHLGLTAIFMPNVIATITSNTACVQCLVKALKVGGGRDFRVASKLARFIMSVPEYRDTMKSTPDGLILLSAIIENIPTQTEHLLLLLEDETLEAAQVAQLHGLLTERLIPALLDKIKLPLRGYTAQTSIRAAAALCLISGNRTACRLLIRQEFVATLLSSTNLLPTTNSEIDLECHSKKQEFVFSTLVGILSNATSEDSKFTREVVQCLTRCMKSGEKHIHSFAFKAILEMANNANGRRILFQQGIVTTLFECLQTPEIQHEALAVIGTIARNPESLLKLSSEEFTAAILTPANSDLETVNAKMQFTCKMFAAILEIPQLHLLLSKWDAMRILTECAKNPDLAVRQEAVTAFIAMSNNPACRDLLLESGVAMVFLEMAREESRKHKRVLKYAGANLALFADERFLDLLVADVASDNSLLISGACAIIRSMPQKGRSFNLLLSDKRILPLLMSLFDRYIAPDSENSGKAKEILKTIAVIISSSAANQEFQSLIDGPKLKTLINFADTCLPDEDLSNLVVALPTNPAIRVLLPESFSSFAEKAVSQSPNPDLLLCPALALCLPPKLAPKLAKIGHRHFVESGKFQLTDKVTIASTDVLSMSPALRKLFSTKETAELLTQLCDAGKKDSYLFAVLWRFLLEKLEDRGLEPKALAIEMKPVVAAMLADEALFKTCEEIATDGCQACVNQQVVAATKAVAVCRIAECKTIHEKVAATRWLLALQIAMAEARAQSEELKIGDALQVEFFNLVVCRLAVELEANGIKCPGAPKAVAYSDPVSSKVTAKMVKDLCGQVLEASPCDVLSALESSAFYLFPGQALAAQQDFEKKMRFSDWAHDLSDEIDLSNKDKSLAQLKEIQQRLSELKPNLFLTEFLDEIVSLLENLTSTLQGSTDSTQPAPVKILDQLKAKLEELFSSCTPQDKADHVGKCLMELMEETNKELSTSAEGPASTPAATEAAQLEKPADPRTP